MRHNLHLLLFPGHTTKDRRSVHYHPVHTIQFMTPSRRISCTPQIILQNEENNPFQTRTELGQPSARVHRIGQLRSVGPVLRVALIAIQIQPVVTRRRLHALVILNCVDPLRPSASLFWLRPPSVQPKNSAQSDHPRRDLDIDESYRLSQEEGASGVSSIYQLTDLSP